MSGPRLRGTIWQLQDRVPDDVAQRHKGTKITVTVAGDVNLVTIGQQVKVSLQTSDKRVAQERYLSTKAQLTEAFEKLRQAGEQGPISLTDRQCGEIAGNYFGRIKDQHRDNAGDARGWDAANSIAIDEGKTKQGQEGLHGRDADELLLARGMVLTPESRERLLSAMHRAYLDAVTRVSDWAKGDFRSMEGGEKSYPKPVEVKAKPKLTLADVRDAWVKDRQSQGKRPQSISMFRQNFGSLVTFMGGDDQRDANSVTPDDIESWLGKLVEKGLARKTIGDGYLTLVKAGFQQSRRKLTHWPFEGIKFTVPKLRRERPPGYSDDEASTILEATKVGLGVGDKTSGHMQRTYRWVPWVCAYTGARVGEIVQLRKQDFQEEAGIKVIRITPEEEGVVKSGQYRDVPIHPHLLAEGFWDMVEAMPEGRLFMSPEMKATTTVANRLRKWIKKEGGMTDSRLSPNHAWRHRFIRLARGRMEEQVWESITGHEDGRASAGYGGADLVTLAQAIALIPWVKVS